MCLFEAALPSLQPDIPNGRQESEAASTTAGKTLMLSAEEPRRYLFIDAADTQ
jgi:hypothetical protein